MVYLWTIPDDYPEKLLGEYQKDTSPDRFEFRKGELLPESIGTPRFTFRCSLADLEGCGDLCNNAQIPLLSEDVALLLQKYAGNSIQLFDTIVQTSDGESSNYKLLNISKTVKGLDKEKSKYTTIPGMDQIMGFSFLSYKSDCMEDSILARDEEYRGHLLVEGKLANELMDLKKKGIGLYIPEDMDWS
jgi:hypothetical protein